jgi:hypothetical protein
MRMKSMRRRRRLLLILPLLSGLLLLPQVRWPVYGWLRGEAFYQGMPTSYWREECRHWLPREIRISATPQVEWNRQSSEFEKWRDSFLHLPKNETFPLITGDPQCLPVLIELLQFEDKQLSRIVLYALERIGSGAVAVVPILAQRIREDDPLDLWVAHALWSIDPKAARKAVEARWRRDCQEDRNNEINGKQ